MKPATRLGIIGSGRMGKAATEIFSKMDKVVLVNLCSKQLVDKKILKSYENKEIVKDYRNAIEEIDAVYIASPSYLHKEMALYAIKRGKHVLLEKPMALTLEDAQLIVKTGEKNKIVLLPSLPERFNANYQKIKEMLSKKSIGKISSIATYRATKSTIRPSWMWDPKKSGGLIVDLSIHDIDLVNWFVDSKAKKVSAQGNSIIYRKKAKSRKNFIDTANICIQFKNKIIAHVFSSWALPDSFPSWSSVGMKIFGQKGTMDLDTGLRAPLAICSNQNPNPFIQKEKEANKWMYLDFSRADALQKQFNYFIDCVNNNTTKTMPSGKDGLDALKIALLAKKSISKNKTFNL